jgi:Flp pilus assembly protein TadG
VRLSLRIRRSRRSLLGDRNGAAAIEFALAVTGFLVFLIGTIEISRAVWTSNALQFAVEQASRLVLANPAATDAQITAYVVQQLVSVDSSRVSIAVERETVNGVQFVGVVGTYQYSLLSLSVEGGLFTLSGRSRIPLQS